MPEDIPAPLLVLPQHPVAQGRLPQNVIPPGVAHIRLHGQPVVLHTLTGLLREQQPGLVRGLQRRIHTGIQIMEGQEELLVDPMPMPIMRGNMRTCIRRGGRVHIRRPVIRRRVPHGLRVLRGSIAAPALGIRVPPGPRRLKARNSILVHTSERNE